MDRSLIPKKIPPRNRLGHLFTRRRWNKLRDVVKNKMYKNNENSFNNIIQEAKVNEINNATYVPSENIRYTIEDEPLTNATIFNPSQNIDNYGYNENINLYVSSYRALFPLMDKKLSSFCVKQAQPAF
jgi:hypothetical protein